MNIPNLPTDNLYKFKFLSGILILIFTCYIYVTQMYVIILNIDNAEVNEVKYKINKEIITRNYRLIESEIKAFEENFTKMYSKDLTLKFASKNVKINSINKNERRLIELEQNLNKLKLIDNNAKNIESLKITLSQLQERKDALNLEFQISIKKAKLEIQKLKYITIFLGLLFVSGIFISIRGYKEWYELVQKPNDIKLQDEVNKILAEKLNTSNHIL